MIARPYVVKIEIRQRNRRQVVDVPVEAYSAKDAAFQARIKSRIHWSFARAGKVRVLGVAPQQQAGEQTA